MPLKHTTPVLNNELRNRAIAMLETEGLAAFNKINNCRYGIILQDIDGNDRYVQVNIKITKFDEKVSAQEIMQEECDKYSEQLEREKRKEQEKKEKLEKAKAKEKVKKEENGET